MTDHLTDQLALALAELRASHVAQTKALTALETAFQMARQGRLDSLSLCDAPHFEHRRAHRPGKASKISTDPGLQVFIEARIDRLTFVQIAVDIAAHFPAERRVSHSSIHRWWQTRTRKVDP